MKSCAMRRITVDDDAGELSVPNRCDWPVVDEVDGAPLCWVHAAAARAGTRDVELECQPPHLSGVLSSAPCPPG